MKADTMRPKRLFDLRCDPKVNRVAYASGRCGVCGESFRGVATSGVDTTVTKHGDHEALVLTLDIHRSRLPELRLAHQLEAACFVNRLLALYGERASLNAF